MSQDDITIDERVDSSIESNITNITDASRDLPEYDLFTKPIVEFHYGIPPGNTLTESERKRYGDALLKAINNQNYFYGDYSRLWPLNGIGRVEVEIYKDDYLRSVYFIILNPVDVNQEVRYYSIALSFGTNNDFRQLIQSSFYKESLYDSREMLVGFNLRGPLYKYIDCIDLDIPLVYPPNDPDVFPCINKIIDDLKEFGICNFTLYTGLQEDYYNYKPNKDVLVYSSVIEYCVVTDEKKYIGSCSYHSDSPSLGIDHLGSLYHEPYDDIESYRIEQMIKLGNKYEVTG